MRDSLPKHEDALADYIKQHERGGEFLDWIAEHEAALDWLAALVREKISQNRYPVGPGYLIERLRYDYPGDLGGGRPKINQGWAPLLARLLMLEYPDLNGAVRIDSHLANEVGAEAPPDTRSGRARKPQSRLAARENPVVARASEPTEGGAR